MIPHYIELFPYVALAARYQEDITIGNDNPHDYIETTLAKWFDEPVTCQRLFPGNAFTIVIRTLKRTIIVNLGTRNEAEWKSNVFGYFFTWRKLMHSGYGKAAEQTFNALLPWLRKDYQIDIIGHSRGGPRSAGLALLAKQELGVTCRTVMFNPPPGFTKKGVRLYSDLGLQECTTSVFSGNNDIVDSAGGWKYDHVGSSITLPKVHTTMGDMPLVGGHAYSTDMEALKKFAYEKLNNQEAVDYIISRQGVCTV